MTLLTSTLHIHLDESGDLTFSPKGTRFYIFVTVWTYDPAPLARDLAALRFRLFKQGRNIEHFHATEDDEATRKLVIGQLVKYPAWRCTTVVVEKRKVPPADREPMWRFYSRYASHSLRFILRSPARAKAHTVLIYTDRLPQQVHRESAEKAIKKACRWELSKPIPPEFSRRWRSADEERIRIRQKIQEEIGKRSMKEVSFEKVGPEPQTFADPEDTTKVPAVIAGAQGIPLHVFHHSAASNPWLQVADYCAWAIRSKWERGDDTFLIQLKRHLAAPEYNILENDPTIYY